MSYVGNADDVQRARVLLRLRDRALDAGDYPKGIAAILKLKELPPEAVAEAESGGAVKRLPSVDRFLDIGRTSWREADTWNVLEAAAADLNDYFSRMVAPEMGGPVWRFPTVGRAYDEYVKAHAVLSELQKRGQGGRFGEGEIKAAVSGDAQALENLVGRIRDFAFAREYGLLEPADLPAEYDAFCEVLLSHPEVVNHDIDGLDNAIYALYMSGTSQAQKTPHLADSAGSFNMGDLTAFWSAIWAASGQTAHLQLKPAVPVGDVLEFCESADVANLSSEDLSKLRRWARAFVYIEGDGRTVTHRVYATPAAADVGRFTEWLIKNGGFGVVDFKFAGPFDYGSRSDSLVVYCSSREVADFVAKEMAGNVEEGGRPAMTEAAGGSESIGIGAEPGPVATGMRTNLPKPSDPPTKPLDPSVVPRGLGHGEYAADVQSFGMIRSEVLASALVHMRENRDWAKILNLTDAELFKRLVAAGLKGFGAALDPTAQ